VLQDGAAHLYLMPISSRRRRTAAEVSDSLYSTSGIAWSSLRTLMIQGLAAAAASLTAARLVSAQQTADRQHKATAVLAVLMRMAAAVCSCSGAAGQPSFTNAYHRRPSASLRESYLARKAILNLLWL